ncbi:flagellar hook-basal body complex protein, partial [Arthrobacter deserti]|nr:flagellar hook-basal body complex protein [Arthrobacter deserti]
VLQGWMAVNGQIPVGGAVTDLDLSPKAVSPAKATTAATVTGNLPSDAQDGDKLVRDTRTYAADGSEQNLSLTFTWDDANSEWDVTDAANAAVGTVTFDAQGRRTSAASLTVGGLPVDVSALAGYAGMTTVSFSDQNGRAAGTLESFTMSPDGTLVGSFSNGSTEVVGRVALATFTNPGGLEKAGSSSYRGTVNSGAVEMGTAGSAGLGTLSGGSLEMSNVDLTQEFTNLIVAQRGFQANARIITTSDEVLQELTNLKR